MTRTTMPLARFTVLDLTRVRAGPTAVRQLADWGANVIKIEAPEAVDKASGMGGARHGPDFQNLHRNKRSMTLNLKDPAGRAAFMRLVERADVVVENYRPDVKSRLGIDYSACRAVNRRIVYASVSGFGQEGTVSHASRVRSDRTGDRRADVDHRPARSGTGAGRGAHRGSGGRALRIHRHLHRAARTRGGPARAVGCTRRCWKRRSRCSTSRRRAGRWPARCRPRPGTTTPRAYRPGCSRLRTGTSTSRPAAA